MKPYKSLLNDFMENMSVNSLIAKEKAANTLKEIIDSKGITFPSELAINAYRYNSEDTAVSVDYEVDKDNPEPLLQIYGKGKFRKKDRAIVVNPHVLMYKDKFNGYFGVIRKILEAIKADMTPYPGFYSL